MPPKAKPKSSKQSTKSPVKKHTKSHNKPQKNKPQKNKEHENKEHENTDTIKELGEPYIPKLPEIPISLNSSAPSKPLMAVSHPPDPASPINSDNESGHSSDDNSGDNSGDNSDDESSGNVEKKIPKILGGASEVHVESKSKYLNINVCSTNRVEGLVVSVSFNAKGASCDMLAAMRSQGRCFPKGAEEAAVCYAIYENIKAVLIGNPRAYAKNKVSNITCGLLNGDFFINWQVKANFSAIGKTLKIVALLLAPAKYYSIYQRLVKSCGGDVSRDGFTAAANAITDSIKSGVRVAIVGKINIRDVKVARDKLSEIGKAIDTKISLESAGSGKKNAEYNEPDYSGTAEVKVNGWAGLVLLGFISDKLRGFPVILCDKVLRVGVAEAQFNTQKNKLAKMADDYVKQKYGSLDNDLGRVFAFHCMSLGMVGAADATLMCKGIKGADVASKLKALLS
jgi:hypothetical protein